MLAMTSSPAVGRQLDSGKLSGNMQSNGRGGQARGAHQRSPEHRLSSARSKQPDSSRSSSGPAESRGPGILQSDSSADTTLDSLTRKTEEDISPVLPLFL